MRRFAGFLAVRIIAWCLASPAALAADSPHGDLRIGCEECHTTGEWLPLRRPISFRHDATDFPLTGAHAGAHCRDCHESPVFSHVGTSCLDCHRDAHAGELGSQCVACHDPAGWENQREMFDRHGRTLFPLLAAHATLDCESCHGGQRPFEYKSTPIDCYPCHEPAFAATSAPDHRAAGFGTDCESCHSPLSRTWRGVLFQHPPTFPLSGVHATLDCSACHSGGFSGAAADCYACHAEDYAATTDPNHPAAGFPTACEGCHGTASWLGAEFNHDLTAFPLDGGHRPLDCDACHAGGFAGTPTACHACHADDYNRTRDPNHAAAGFPTRCEDCHNTRDWDDADFDHDARYFPIYRGEHRGEWDRCSDCHVQPSSYAVFDCTVCHEHRRDRMDSEHRGIGGYVYQSQACFNCHPDGRADD